MPRKYSSYSTAEWQQIMVDFSASGLSQKAFCQQRGLAPSTFSKWRSQLGFSGRNPQQPAATDFQPLIPAGLPVQPLPQPAMDIESETRWQVELSLGNGLVLRLQPVG